MILYDINPDENNWGKLYSDDVIGSHRWFLPGVKCPSCRQTWTTIGIIYPVIDLTGTPMDELLREPRAAHLEEYETLQAELREYVPDHLPLSPGTHLGSLVGKAKGKMGDFVWQQLWNLLITHEAYVALTDKNILMPDYGIPHLNFGKKPPVDLFELQIELGASLSPKSLEPVGDVCSLCGRDTRKVRKVILDQSTIPTDKDIFRIRGFSSQIIGTERFKCACEELNLSNITFTPVEVA